MQIIPSILVQTAEEFIEQTSAIEKVVEQAQLDIADGKFVPNKTWGDPKIVKKEPNLNIELHLMVERPLSELKKWKEVEQVKRVLLHYETIKDLGKILDELKKYSWEIGVVLNPNTPAEVLKSHIDKLQSVMFMGVHPGFQGQELIPAVLEKIQKFSEKYPNKFTELDGAVNEKTLPNIIASGVKAICPGSAIFGNKRTPEENIKRIKKLL